MNNIITKYLYGKNVVGFDEYVLSLGTFCSLDCEYCYLKYFKKTKNVLTYEIDNFVEAEIEKLFSSGKKFFYLNTGETTDSLLTLQHWKKLCKLSHIILNLAKKYNITCYLEIRTKTDNILKFPKLPIQSEHLKIVYSATITPQLIIDTFEKNTASFKQRLAALKYAMSLNFLISVNFEPIIFWPILGIKQKDVLHSLHILINNYRQIIHQLSDVFDHQNFYKLTLSCLRLTKEQFKILLNKKSKLCFFEMFLCEDGKYRYSRPIRVTIYKEIINFVKSLYPKIENKIFLSFEFDYIWRACGLEIKNL